MFFNKSVGNLIPLRNEDSLTGSQFIKNNLNIKNNIRDQNILNEFLIGNIPDFLRQFKIINLTLQNDNLSYLVMSDYLSIGSDSDYVRMPMSPLTAKIIADKYDCILPTKYMVDTIWKNSVNKLQPKPWGPPFDHSMSDTYRYGIHNDTINKQLIDKDKSQLTSGHKKDVVINSNLLFVKNKVCIYGWIQPNGIPIQDENCSSHDQYYHDYSHGIRLIAKDMMLNNNLVNAYDILNHKHYYKFLTNQQPYNGQYIYT